jgi:hypothetical protein
MLCRLKMSIKECRAAYRVLSLEAFQAKKYRATPAIKLPWNWNLKARFDSEALEKGIKQVIVEALKKFPQNQSKEDAELENTLLKEDNPSCKMYVIHSATALR